MALCPVGHTSTTDDFCDVCGMRIAGPPPPTAPLSTSGQVRKVPGGTGPGRGGPGQAGGNAEYCPRCDTARTGQFCEACGFNFAGGARPGSARPGGGQPGSARPGGGQPGGGQPGSGQPGSARPGSAPYPAQPGSAAYPAQPGSSSYPSQPGSGSAAYPAPPGSAAQPGSSGYPARPGSAPYPAQPGRYAPPPAAPSGPSPSSGPYRPQAPPAPLPPAAAPYPQAAWTAVVSADRAYYEQVRAATGPDGADISFPAYCAERRFQLAGNQMRIGRRSKARGLEPEIDLSGPPTDPGISRMHAVLLAAADGSWAVLDPGSANGTLLNGREIAVGDQVPLHDGDRINLGAWTAITVHRG